MGSEEGETGTRPEMVYQGTFSRATDERVRNDEVHDNDD